MNTISPDYQIIVIGTGFSGLGMGIALKKAGINDFAILEKANDVGGTWRDNHYPGCACDVQSHLYSFSFEPNPNWSRMYAPQPEIKKYLQHCARKYGLLSHIQF
ncbi:MAG TPA: NAD(P)/FAD-dependent oxidoreductase, partial [Agitococcus sp.]|nr:NAD(P)/FAD-dependent oxidoreductase [Agitococcus sp.]